jgi:hypothetical protein
MPAIGTEAPFYQRPADLLQQLIRFYTTNPPGNVAERLGVEDVLERTVSRDDGLLADKRPFSGVSAFFRPNVIHRVDDEPG